MEFSLTGSSQASPGEAGPGLEGRPDSPEPRFPPALGHGPRYWDAEDLITVRCPDSPEKLSDLILSLAHHAVFCMTYSGSSKEFVFMK